MKKISCLILDMGGVLTEDQREDKLADMMGLLGSGSPRERFLEAYWKHRFDYDRGVADAAAYWARVASELGAQIPSRRLGDIVQADLDSWFNMRESMLEFLGGVKGRVGRLVLLSNLNADGARFVRSERARPWVSRFDDLVLSCEHRLLKPEAAIYELALDAAGVLPGEALFIDDNEANVEGARRAGLESFRFAGEEDFVAILERDYELIRQP
jgi:putative hydrolase of the HAD superfamily